MSYQLRYFSLPEKEVAIQLPASKSISNRLLIAQALSGKNFEIEGLSTAEDTIILEKALAAKSRDINVGMAGTAFRFLTAYYSIRDMEVILSGAERMHQRPIRILVDQLRRLGASIEYLENEGFPPLKIKGGNLKGDQLTIDGSISSQYITALLLIAPYLPSGLKLSIENRLVSQPYVNMTIRLIRQLGVEAYFESGKIEVKKGDYHAENPIQVESDWSAAAFFYQFVAFSDLSIVLKNLNLNSIQGDKQAVEVFEKLGVKTVEKGGNIYLTKTEIKTREASFDMLDCPDLIPSLAVTASQLLEKTSIRGVSTLRIKESNRVEALQNELHKIGARLIDQSEDEILIIKEGSIQKKPVFEVYNDHRMAMSLAPLATIFPAVVINHPEVVKKSYPEFWAEIRKLGIEIS